VGSAAKQKHADAETEAKKAKKAGVKGSHKPADKHASSRHGAGRSSGKKSHARK
jgi:hypothetical protein